MPAASVYIGIDVACAIGKRLPICVVSGGRPITPLMIPKHLAGLIPRGDGNKEIAAAAPFREVVRGVVSAIDHIAIEMGWQIERIAADALAAPPATGSRKSERLLLSKCQLPVIFVVFKNTTNFQACDRNPSCGRRVVMVREVQ